MSEEQNNIRVICRFRPQNKIETNAGGSPILQITEGKNIYLNPESGQKQHFSFDRVFDGTCTQKEVYESAAKPVIDFLLEGYNGTLFVYGQTSSGKTHTMQGPDIDDDNLKGIIPRMVEDIFNSIAEADETMEFLVQVSYVEIYREKIQDLLNPEKKNLNVRQNQQKGVYIEFCTEVYVSSKEQVLNVIKTGQSNRSISSTEMNAESSRSHSIFIITVISNNTSQGTKKQARLYLVDLAGSEKVAKTGAKGDTLKEAQAINQSLSALGNVINALTEGGTNKHVPYRDSKLTRILQESLGGNSKTTLIINCSPSSYNYDETVSTLRFGNRAKSIKNTPKQNKQRSVEELTIALEHAEGTISKLNILVTSLTNELKVFKGDINIDLLNPSTSFSSPNLTSSTNDTNTNNDKNNLISQNTTTSSSSTSSSDIIKELQLKIEKLEESLSGKEKELSISLEQQDLLQQTLQSKEMEIEENGKKIEEFKESIQESIIAHKSLLTQNELMLNKLTDLRLQLNKKEYELQLNLSEIETLQSSQQNSEKEMGQLQNQVSTLLHSLQDKEEQVKKLQNLQSLHSYHSLQIHHPTNGSLTMNGSPRNSTENTNANTSPTTTPTTTTTTTTTDNTTTPTTPSTTNNTTTVDNATTTPSTTNNITTVDNNDSVNTTNDNSTNTINTINTTNTTNSTNTINTTNTTNTMDNTPSEQKVTPIENSIVNVNDSLVNDKKIDENVSSTTPTTSSDISTHERSEEEKKNYEKVKKEVEEVYERKMKERETEHEKNITNQFLFIHQIIENSKNNQKEKNQKVENMTQFIVNDLSERCHKLIDFKALLEEGVKKFKLLISDSNSRDLMKKNYVLEKNITQFNEARSQLIRQNNGLKVKLNHEEKNSKIKSDRIDQIEKEIQELRIQLEQKDTLHKEQVKKHENLLEYYEKNSKGQHYQKTYLSNIAVPIRGGSKKPTNN